MSRQIINFAQANGVRTVRMEDLTGIRKTAKSKKEAGRNLHSWAHHQLQQFIAYKAQLAGMDVEFVNPNYTSQTCKCGYAHKSNRTRHRFCCRQCGYTAHSDANASINITRAIRGVSERSVA